MNWCFPIQTHANFSGRSCVMVFMCVWKRPKNSLSLFETPSRALQLYA